MRLKSKLTPEIRIQLLFALGPLSGLAFILSIFLERIGNTDLEFLSGFLIGFAIVGNLTYICITARYLRNKSNK